MFHLSPSSVSLADVRLPQMWLLLFTTPYSALYRHSSTPHLRLRGGDSDESEQPGQETLAQALAMSQARAAAPVRMSLDPARYRSSSQGPPKAFPPPEFGEIDRVIDRATQTAGWAPVIPQYNGTLRWARHQWKGTINEHLWRPAAVSMIVPLLFIGGSKFVAPTARWFPSPDDSHPVFATLLSISHGWGHLLGLTTFVVTFFVGHAHSYWRNCYKIARQVQGRLNDLGMLAGAHAARDPDGTITPDAAALLERLARQVRPKMPPYAYLYTRSRPRLLRTPDCRVLRRRALRTSYSGLTWSTGAPPTWAPPSALCSLPRGSTRCTRAV